MPRNRTMIVFLIFLVIFLLSCPSNVFSRLPPEEREQLARPDEYEKSLLKAQVQTQQAHKRPLRLGKKTRHGSLRGEIKKQFQIDEKKGEGRYKDLLDQDMNLDPSFMIVDPIIERGKLWLQTYMPASIHSYDNTFIPSPKCIHAYIRNMHTCIRIDRQAYRHTCILFILMSLVDITSS